VLALGGCTLADAYQPELVTAPLAPDAGQSAMPPSVSAPAQPTGAAGSASSCGVPEEPSGCVLPIDGQGVVPSESCAADTDCASKHCQNGACQAASCDDGIANQGEVDVDCGGPCPLRCALGSLCKADSDCDAGLFCPAGSRKCALVSCQDGLRNGSEILADCGGGACPGCPTGTPCTTGADCLSAVCNAGACAAGTCRDGVKNQTEVDVDCGGSCPACAPGRACNAAADCQSRVCAAAGCRGGVELCCQTPTCDDGVANGTEPTIDCGNAQCGACALGSACTANAQCGTGLCTNGKCQLPPCANGQRDGDETDVDCGGRCGPCAPGFACASDTGCQSGICQDGRCCGGNEGDCTRCARRLAPFITCANNGPTGQADCDGFLQCLADNASVCTIRYAPGCSDTPGSVCDTARFGNNGPGVALADAILGSAGCTF